MQRPIHTRLGAIAGGTQKSGKSHRHFAEQRRDPVRPPVLHVASPAAGTAIRTKPPMLIGLTRSDRSLNARQKQLRLGKAQAQVRDLPKAFRPADLNQVSAPRDGIIACLDQPHHPPHRSSSSRSLNRLVVPILSASPHTPNLWTVPYLANGRCPPQRHGRARGTRRAFLRREVLRELFKRNRHPLHPGVSCPDFSGSKLMRSLVCVALAKRSS